MVATSTLHIRAAKIKAPIMTAIVVSDGLCALVASRLPAMLNQNTPVNGFMSESSAPARRPDRPLGSTAKPPGSRQEARKAPQPIQFKNSAPHTPRTRLNPADDCITTALLSAMTPQTITPASVPIWNSSEAQKPGVRPRRNASALITPGATE